ncbi:transcriptional initiation protein Tat [uncultured Rhodoblastus sp.]|uniref:thiosulfate dehydrogenase n=1 Tax=uncultured Rhodoblastus sp. TaxID=543037 RepID=UPI0025FA207B|nr:transcriptional initiation protein Tat [uncultured Rhodoblastus sp.]
MSGSGMRRREALLALSLGFAVGLAGFGAARAEAGKTAKLPPGSDNLANLATRLEKAPRRRDFQTVPMILDRKDLWDYEALEATLAYRGNQKQIWNNADLGGPWLDLMRDALDVQVLSWRHPNFLAVSATHGSAHLALLDQAVWDKYKLAKIAANPKDPPASPALFAERKAAIQALQKRGAVFLACHDTIWELAGRLIADGVNPDKLSPEALSAELTNHLLPGVVLTPGIVGTLPEFQLAGFYYVQ